jgi:hypothetical protein
MAESAIAGLFQTPEMYQQLREQQARQQAMEYAQLTPQQRVMFGAAQAGQQIGRGIGQLFGVEDPQLKMISQRNALARQIDPNNPQSYIDVAKMAAQSGDPQFAMSLAAVGQDAMNRQAQMRQNLATAQKTESALLQEKQLRDELAKLGPNPASDQVISVVAKFGSPDKLLSVVQTSMDRGEARRQQAEQAELNRKAAFERQQEANRAALERQQEANAARIEAARERGATMTQLAQMRVDAQQENIRLRQQLKTDEKAANVARGMDALNSELDNLNTAYSTLNDLRAIPSTERGAISNILSSISASGAGQVVGRTLGTVEQTERDVIGGSRMRLLNAIKEATGMSAQQLNSNVELSTWLKAVSDPSQSIQAVTKNLDNIRTWVNKRSGGMPEAPSETTQPAPSQAAINDLKAGKGSASQFDAIFGPGAAAKALKR